MNTDNKRANHIYSSGPDPIGEKEPDSLTKMHSKEIYEIQLKDIKEFENNLPKIEALLKENKKGQGSFDDVILKDAVKAYKRMKILFNKLFFLCGNCGHLIVAYPNYKAGILLICLTLSDFVFVFSFFPTINNSMIFGALIPKFFLFVLLSLIATLLTFFIEVLIMSYRSSRRIFLKSKCDHCGKKVIDFEKIIL